MALSGYGDASVLERMNQFLKRLGKTIGLLKNLMLEVFLLLLAAIEMYRYLHSLR